MTPTLLEVTDVTKKFGGLTAADHVTVRIAAGEVVAVVGPNGAGKTTFINLITGWLAPDSGNIRFAGQKIGGLSPKDIVLAGLSRSFQISQIFPSLTVCENLKIAIQLHDTRVANLMKPFEDQRLEESARNLASKFRLVKFINQPTSELSQGTKKLLDIAMAMARAPKLLLLDEPTSGVSADEKDDLMSLVIDTCTSNGATVLFVEHDMDVVRRFARRIIAFVGGRVVCDDEPDKAFQHEFFVAQQQYKQPRAVSKGD